MYLPLALAVITCLLSGCAQPPPPGLSAVTEGVRVTVDRVDLIKDRQGSEEYPHVFAYTITIKNEASKSFTLFARKWDLRHADGTQKTIEGEGVIGETPTLAPGQSHTYQSFIYVKDQTTASGHFKVRFEGGRIVEAEIPTFAMGMSPENLKN